MNTTAFMHGLVDELYHGSPHKLDELRAGPRSQGIFLTKHKGIASLFIPSKKDIPGVDRYSGINFGYKEWGKRKQDKPHSKITITHNAKDLPRASGTSKGYIYRVKVDPKILEEFKKNPGSADIEMVYPAEQLSVEGREPHTVRWTTQFDTGRARKYGPAEKRAGLVVHKSPIHGKGLFTTDQLDAGENIGLGMTQVSRTGELNKDYEQTPRAKKVNHSDRPNMRLVRRGKKIFMVTAKPVGAGEEITSDYGDASVQVARDFLKTRG